MNPAEIERVVGAITEKDVMKFAQDRIWDQDVAVSALGSIEGVRPPYQDCSIGRGMRANVWYSCWTTSASAATPAVTSKR